MKRIFCLIFLLLCFPCLSVFATESNRPKVSIIVPVYNVEPWFRECMDSLINQTLKEIEIICVDDGTPDNCDLILDEYARKDARVKAIHQVNSGVQAARNAGVAAATGEYIAFADSDDYLDINTYRVAYSLAKKDNVDIIQFGNRMFWDGNDGHEKETNFSDSQVMSLDEFWAQTSSYYVWDKLFRAELIKKDNIRFMPGIKPADDTCFSYMALGRAKTFKLIPGRFYNYRLREGSISRMSAEDIFLNSYKMFKYISDDWSIHNCLKGKESTLLTGLVRWIHGGYYDASLEHPTQLLGYFNSKIRTPKVIQSCPKYVQDYMTHLKYASAVQKNQTLQDGEYIITSGLKNNKVLDIKEASWKNNANLQLWDRNDSNAQRFELKRNEKGYFTLKAKCSGKMLDVCEAGKNIGTNVQQYEDNGSDAQKWYIIPTGKNFYRIVSKCNLLSLDVEHAKTENGTNIRCWERNFTGAQKFKFIKVG